MIMIPSAAAPAPDLASLARQFFGETDSPLRASSRADGGRYEYRPQQQAMAEAVAQAIESKAHLCVEAPTGVGKSFAYLVPAIHHALACRRPVIISTHTIALQEQLVDRDIPMLQALLGISFRVALAKGRENYVCRHRLQNATNEQLQFLPSDDLLPEIDRITRWEAGTRTGSRSDLDFAPTAAGWAAVCSEPGGCPLESNSDETCYYRQARIAMRQADIVVTNHALFCVDLAVRAESGGTQSVLPDYAAVILDEAHSFEDVAAVHSGLRLTSFSFRYWLNRLYNPRLHRGLLMRRELASARDAVIRAAAAADRFFAGLADWLGEQPPGPVTYGEPGMIVNPLVSAWSELEATLREAIADAGEAEYVYELRTAASRVAAARQALDDFLEMRLSDSVYWLERAGGRRGGVRFNVVPVDISEILRARLFERGAPVVLTSATLAVDGDLSYVQRRLGMAAAETLILDAPFDYARQTALHVPASAMPSPSAGDPWLDALAAQVKVYLEQTHGKAFVLFTSHHALQRVAALVEDFLRERGIAFYVQGRELQRSQMLERFRADVDSVIFGTDSFWTGVDVPGEALSNVIITRLPFAVPSHPLAAARRERIAAAGEDPFKTYFLPEAVLKFRQGIGRLIRTQTDSGIIVVLDPRIVRSGYGRAFLNAVPACPQYID
jgi:ATP-dependent DNA helicase DinG